ncbi:rhodopsin-like [Xiphophorus maculatus]|uniref:rhodopsin-like n=1 Tax=Xiphophorus maculatus TaxID=8083 RepID=UPI0003B582AC|nr:rhodopsin-like [Xiphophorus maculatus]
MDADKLIQSIVRILMFIAGILGNNLLVIASLPRKKSEIRTNEILLINLAVSNLITNYLVDIPVTMEDFAGRWFLGLSFCGIFHFSSDLSETSSLFTTLIICIFWHQKLVGSLKRGGAPVQLDNLHLLGCLLAGSWTLSAIFSMPRLFFVSQEVKNESHENCIDVFPDVLSRETYEVIFLSLANALPVAGIWVASIQIVLTLLQHRKRIQSVSSHRVKVKQDKSERSVSSVSVQDSHKDLKESSSPTEHVSSCPNGKCLGKSPRSSPLANKTDSRAEAQPNHSVCQSSQIPSKQSNNASSQVRAAKSVVAVATVVLLCWLTHLILRISNSMQDSPLMMELASYIGAAYTCIIPYIFLHGVKKLSRLCK